MSANECRVQSGCHNDGKRAAMEGKDTIKDATGHNICEQGMGAMTCHVRTKIIQANNRMSIKC